MRASVSDAKLSASASSRSLFIRAMFSPGIVRRCSPAASSVVSISASAVESQATARLSRLVLEPEDGDGTPRVHGRRHCPRGRGREIARAGASRRYACRLPIASTSSAATAIGRRLRAGPRRGGLARSSAVKTSRAFWYRRSGSFSRQRWMMARCAEGTSTPSAGTGRSSMIADTSSSPLSPLNGRRPDAIS